MESGDAYVAATGLCRGLGPGALAPDGALRPLRDQSENRLQMVAPVRAGRPRGPGGRIAPAGSQPDRARCNLGSAAVTHAAGTPDLGPAQTARLPHGPASPLHRLAGGEYGGRPAPARRLGATTPTPPRSRPPRPAAHPDGRAECTLVGGLQRPVPPGHRRLLLSAHHRRRLFPVSPRLLRLAR